MNNFKDDTYIGFNFYNIALEYKDGQFHWISDELPDRGETCRAFDSCPDKVKALYIPAERNLIGNLSPALASILTAGVPLQKLLLEYMSLFEKAKQEFQTYPVDFLHLTFKKTGMDEGIKTDDKEQKYPIPLNHCSSGIQSVLPLLMVIDYSMKLRCFNVFVLEEPEQNLFPSNQTALLRFLISKTHGEGFSARGLMVTTHSPYLLSALNISLLAGRLAKNEELAEVVEDILPAIYHVDSSQVSAYALGDEDVYCRNIINAKTGTIDQNYLDTASDVLSDEFNRLYRLYVKTLI